MKKITFILASLNVGGVEKNTVRLMNSFLNNDYSVDLLLVRYNGDYIKSLDSRINIIRLNEAGILRSLPNIIKYINKEQPTTIISAKDYINIVVLLAKILSFNKTKVITSTRTQVSYELNRMNFFKKIIYSMALKFFYSFADHLVAVSEGVAQDLSEVINIDRNKIDVIYNPIVDEEIQEKSKENFSTFNSDDTVYNLISVGRLAVEKDYPTLLKAIKLVNEEKSVKLYILGEGDQRSKIEKLIIEYNLTEIVFLLGNISNPYPYMKHADLFVLTSKYEGFGNVIVEALAVGTPVVSTDSPSGPREILGNGKYGELVPVEDPLSLKAAIINSLESEIDKQKLINRANRFTVEKALNKYMLLINS